MIQLFKDRRYTHLSSHMPEMGLYVESQKLHVFIRMAIEILNAADNANVRMMIQHWERA